MNPAGVGGPGPAAAGRVVALDYGRARCGFGRLVALIGELDAAAVLVGLPLSLSGADTDQTRETRAFVQRLRERLNVPIEVYDERFTTKLARHSGGAKAEDSRAAAVLLEEWLTRGPSSEPHPDPTEEP